MDYNQNKKLWLRGISDENSIAYARINDTLRSNVYLPTGLTLLEAYRITNVQMRLLNAINAAGKEFAQIEEDWSEK